MTFSLCWGLLVRLFIRFYDTRIILFIQSESDGRFLLYFTCTTNTEFPSVIRQPVSYKNAIEVRLLFRYNGNI